jgi:flavorubredoxin
MAEYVQTETIDYEKPVEIAPGIYWVGFADAHARLHCNPYLIVEGAEAVLIDGGSRSDFSSVLLKILQTGIEPQQIYRLIYQHYDPDLCGSIPNFEAVIGRADLKIISHRANNMFIKYYGVAAPRVCIETMQWQFRFATGRTLQFIRTPYAHAEGSFMTFDVQTGTLFSSDVFGSYDEVWQLFLRLPPECATCAPAKPCIYGHTSCPMLGMMDFHVKVMTSNAALRYALQQVRALPVRCIAPQHGSIIDQSVHIPVIINKLAQLLQVGIDAYVTSVPATPEFEPRAGDAARCSQKERTTP